MPNEHKFAYTSVIPYCTIKFIPTQKHAVALQPQPCDYWVDYLA